MEIDRWAGHGSLGSETPFILSNLFLVYINKLFFAICLPVSQIYRSTCPRLYFLPKRQISKGSIEWKVVAIVYQDLKRIASLEQFI